MVGIANTTTIRAAGRTLKNTGITAATSVEEAVAMLRMGKADAFALSRDSLRPFVAQLPAPASLTEASSKPALPSPYRRTGPNALAYVSAFLEQAKASGGVRRALDRAGFRDEPVAPPAGR